MNNNLFVIEGTDGSGKSTQFKLLCDFFTASGIKYRTVRFPRYDNDSSALLRMYLEGRFGTDPELINPYAASTFFAVDRYASYVTDWKDDYNSGVPILCDRYTTSNAVHQAAKLDEEQADKYLNWLFDYEYNLLGLPSPSSVIFLDVPSEFTFELLNERQGSGGDIHELDHQYLEKCRRQALLVCEKYRWEKIKCVENGRMRTPAEINKDIIKIICSKLEG